MRFSKNLYDSLRLSEIRGRSVPEILCDFLRFSKILLDFLRFSRILSDFLKCSEILGPNPIRPLRDKTLVILKEARVQVASMHQCQQLDPNVLADPRC